MANQNYLGRLENIGEVEVCNYGSILEGRIIIRRATEVAKIYDHRPSNKSRISIRIATQEAKRYYPKRWREKSQKLVGK